MAEVQDSMFFDRRRAIESDEADRVATDLGFGYDDIGFRIQTRPLRWATFQTSASVDLRVCGPNSKSAGFQPRRGPNNRTNGEQTPKGKTKGRMKVKSEQVDNTRRGRRTNEGTNESDKST